MTQSADPASHSAVITRPVEAGDFAAIAELHARVFGPGRFARTAYRVREGRPLASCCCRVALADNRLIAAVRFSPVTVGGKAGALLLGPLAVDADFANQGHGRRLIAEGLQAARATGVALVLLVGDEPYYGRLGFVRLPPGWITLPGPVDPARMLAAELIPGAVAGYRGLIAAEGSQRG